MKWLLVILSVIAIGKANVLPWNGRNDGLDSRYKLGPNKISIPPHASKDSVSNEIEQRIPERHQRSLDFSLPSTYESIHQNLLNLNVTYSRMRDIVENLCIIDESFYFSHTYVRHILPSLERAYATMMDDLLSQVTNLRVKVTNSLCSCESTAQPPHIVNDEERVTSEASTTEEVITEFSPDFPPFLIDESKEKEDHMKDCAEEHEKDHEKDSAEESVKEENKELPKLIVKVNPIPNYEYETKEESKTRLTYVSSITKAASCGAIRKQWKRARNNAQSNDNEQLTEENAASFDDA